MLYGYLATNSADVRASPRLPWKLARARDPSRTASGRPPPPPRDPQPEAPEPAPGNRERKADGP
jgi:hypothetical protein